MLFCFDIGNRFQTDAGCSGKFLLRNAKISSGLNQSAGNGVCTGIIAYVSISIFIYVYLPKSELLGLACYDNPIQTSVQ